MKSVQNFCKGPVVGSMCMDIAMKKAKENGVGWVTAKGTVHVHIRQSSVTSSLLTSLTRSILYTGCMYACVLTACVDRVSESNHFGIAGWYTMRAAEQGLVVSRS